MAVWYLACFAGVLFIALLIYSQYALLQVLVERRRNGGTGWFVPVWRFAGDPSLSEQGRAFRARYGRSLVVEPS